MYVSLERMGQVWYVKHVSNYLFKLCQFSVWPTIDESWTLGRTPGQGSKLFVGILDTAVFGFVPKAAVFLIWNKVFKIFPISNGKSG